MDFPNDRDRQLVASAQNIEHFAADLDDWTVRFGRPLDGRPMRAGGEVDGMTLEQMRRDATNLLEAARRPAAIAIYGPSQAGKSLLAGQMLTPRDPQHSPLGRDERHGAPGYLPELSFNVDLNPQSGSNEATALVTRFTVGDRLPGDLPRQYPIVARAMSRGQLLCALARGFSMECVASGQDWNATTLDKAVDELGKRYPANSIDVAWRSELLAAYSSMQACDARHFAADEAVLTAVLLRTPLSDEGYIALAARLFWDDWRPLTGLFLRIKEFLTSITSAGSKRSELLVSWAAARFLLDGKRALSHERRGSRCLPRVVWSDIRLTNSGNWPALEYCPDTGAYREPLETIQAALLELVVPVLAPRLQDDWRGMLEQCDILDIPGLRAGRLGTEQGKRRSAETLDEQLEILKRGKVAYLFEHYTEQLQIQTLLLLVRGGNLEVTGSLKYHIDRWGRARYGAELWPGRVPDGLPALFIGLTGIDEEFRQRTEFAEPMLYDTRLSQLEDALGNVVTCFGGENRPFTNIYPLRYPGTWDASDRQRECEDNDKWMRAEQAFLGSAQVRRFVGDSAHKWTEVLRDGGWSVISRGMLDVTDTLHKQEQIESRLRLTGRRLSELAQQWIVSTDGRAERNRRLACAQRMLDWLTSDARLIYMRVEGLRQTLCLHEGDQYALSDAAIHAPHSPADRRNGANERFDETLRSFWLTWADQRVAQIWDRYTHAHPDARPWPTPDEIAELSVFLKDYFCSPALFTGLATRLLQVVGVKLRDESARRETRRRYVRLLLNDLILSPGFDDERRNGDREPVEREFGLMTPFVRRWQRRLPMALAGGVGEVADLAPGNDDLMELVRRFAIT